MANAAGQDLSAEGTEYHRKLLALGEQDGTPPAELASSYIAIAEYEVRSGREKGDWALAARYLEKVAGTNAPLREKAEIMLRALRVREAYVEV